MDEILRHAQPSSAALSNARGNGSADLLRRRLLKAAAAVRTGGRAVASFASLVRYKLDHAMAGRKLINPLPFFAVAGVAALALIVSTVYSPSYKVTVDGQELGLVADPADFETVVDRVEMRASGILGYDYTLEQDVDYSFALTSEDSFTPAATFETYLFNQVGEVMKTYVLSIDGEVIGAAADRADLEGMLNQLTAPFVNENTTSVDFVEDVSISYQFISSDVMQDLSCINELLCSNSEGEDTYTVVKGDTYSEIAVAHNMSVDDLLAMNPQASLNKLMIGDVLTVKKAIPFLSVSTTESVTYTEEIPCPVTEVKDSSMYKGNTKVLTKGIPGEAMISADVTYVNGYEEGRTVTSSVTLSEPTTEVVAVGTKERPKTLPTGVLKWPLHGRISSYFGYRSIFGTYSFHGGIDIVSTNGTPIAAADGGTVIWSGYKGTYGNLVIVDHGSGVHTYYAHCSALLVSAGDKVYQGQTVGLVGSTGRSTGNHLHFEVRINNNRVNPLSYLTY